MVQVDDSSPELVHRFELKQRMERVTAFKYLEVWISDNLTWSRHIEHAVERATKQTGMIFWRFYTSSNTATLKQLYLSFVRPHLEYIRCPGVGSPPKDPY